MPFLVSTNAPGTGMDAPTWRGAYDRFLILPQGGLNIVELDFYRRIAEEEIPELKMWQFSWQGQSRFDPIWEMVLEGSAGFSGTFARKVTLGKSTAGDELTTNLMGALELAASEGAVVLEAEGVLIENGVAESITLQFVGGSYVNRDERRHRLSHAELVKSAVAGEFVGTFTGRHGANADAIGYPQPALWTLGPIEKQSGHQEFPILFPSAHSMIISGRHIEKNAHVFVDGRRVQGSVATGDDEQIEVKLASLPKPGIHLIQIQNPDGVFSNDFLFNVVESVEAAQGLKARRKTDDRDIRDAIADAIEGNRIDELRKHLNRPRQQGRINEQQPRSGSTPLSHAALHGRLEIANVLMRRGADVGGTNRDGNSPLHIAAFLCRQDLVRLFLETGGSPTKKNRRGETPIDEVSAPWSQDQADDCTAIGKAAGIEVDLERIETDRPRIASMLRAH